MTYNEWEDRGMYAPPMFSAVESGMSSNERLATIIDALTNDGFATEVSKTLDIYPISTREHAGKERRHARWAIQSTLYRLHSITTRETDAALNLISVSLGQELFDTASALLRRWLDEHPSD